MAKKRAKTPKKEKSFIREIFLGIILFVVVQAIFMIGGLLFENSKNIGITGIPSSIGLIILLLIGIFLVKSGKSYLFLGSYILAFLTPIILFVINFFAPNLVVSKYISYSIYFSALLVIIIWIYFIIKIIRGKL